MGGILGKNAANGTWLSTSDSKSYYCPLDQRLGSRDALSAAFPNADELLPAQLRRCDTMHDDFKLQFVVSNGIRLRAAVEGDGPLVMMIHGWPELWYSWRHQIAPVAKAGFRVVVPDLRGYGGSDKPSAVEAYDMSTMMKDIVGIIDSFGEDKAILIGHDWGAPIVWNTAALYPDKVSAVAGLSVPYSKRGKVSTISLWEELYADKFFYQLYFQDKGIAEKELQEDVRKALRKIYYSISGDSPSLESWLDRPPSKSLLDALDEPKRFPSWMTNQDLDYFVANFESGGFQGPINRYRNQQRDFDMLPSMGVNIVVQPSCFIAGSKDVVRFFIPGKDVYKNIDRLCSDLRVTKLIDGVGHWVQQEAPHEVNRALLEFLSTPM